MSQDDLTHDRAAPAGAPSASSRQPPPRRAGGGSLALALLLALLALAGVVYLGWQQWQQRQGHAADSHAVAGLQQRMGTLEHALSDVSGASTLLRQRLGDADQVNRSLRDELLAQNDRVRALEEAVGKLSEKTLSGHDAMLLDETETLLRMGGERYTLFHDAQGAAAAYALAGQSLAAVSDRAFAGVRQSIDAEREALLKSQPTGRDGQLATLEQLRGDVVALPLKPLDTPAASANDGAWARITRALSGVVSIHRDNGAPLAVVDARFARELVALDLAQAQAAMLAWDSASALAALRRADAGLATQFDANSVEVQSARTRLATLLAQLQPAAPVQLGAALSELRNLRAVHALVPATPATAGGAKP